jgi:hypothetical protein
MEMYGRRNNFNYYTRNIMKSYILYIYVATYIRPKHILYIYIFIMYFIYVHTLYLPEGT